MSSSVKTLIRNAHLAGINLGLPGQRRAVRSASVTPAVAARPLFGAPPAPVRTREYELPNPYAERHIPVTEDNLTYADGRGLSEVNLEHARAAFIEYGLDPRDMVSGRTYLMLSESVWGQPEKQIYKACIEHEGTGSQAAKNYMQSLAAHESQRFQEMYERNRGGTTTYRQHMIIIPPHDPETGKIPWFHHQSGAGWEFHWFLHDDKSWQRMGKDLAARLQDSARGNGTGWTAITARPPAPVDYMKEVRRSCGDPRETRKAAATP